MAKVELNIVALGDFKSVNAQIKSLQDQVTLLNKSVASVGVNANLTKQLNEANAAFKATILSTGQFTAQTVRLKAETDKFGEALVGGKLKLTQYFQIIKAGTANATSQMKALAMEQTKLQNSLVMSDPTKQGILSVYTPTKINAVANATKIAANTQNLYNIAVEKGTQSLINWGKNTQWAGRQLTVGMTVPLTIFGSTATRVFKEVNDEIVRLQKVYGTGIQQPTQAALDAIKQQVLSLSKELAAGMGIAVKDTAAMAADLAATGLQGNDLIGATRESIRLQKLGEMDQQDAMQTTISLQNVYKLSTNQLSGAIDFLNAVENQTSTSMQDLAAGIPKVGPIVQQLGGSFKDTALMMVAMKEAGVPAAQSANAIKSALASLINPTKAAKDAFAAYNINLSSIATKTGGNPIQMIMMLQDALKGLQPLAQAQLIEKLFGKFQEARIQALISNLGAVNSQTKQAFDLMNASESQLKGIAAGELKVATESTTGKFKRAVETMKADLLPVGEKIMQVATTLLNFGNSIAKVFGELPSPVKTVLGIVAAGVALSGPIIMFTGVLANFVGYLIKGLFSMKNLINGTKTFGQLFTPEIIASQNAAQLFSQKILQDESAVMLLNKAVRELTVSLEGMAMGMSAASGTGMAAKLLAAEAGLAGGRIPFKGPKMATGGYVPGNPSDGDVYPALLQGGEAVIPTKQATKYGSFINAMIDGKLPGFKRGLKRGNRGNILNQAHMAENFEPGTPEYESLIASDPALAEVAKTGSVKITPDLTAWTTEKLNLLMRPTSKGASIGEFNSGWREGGADKFVGSAARHGADFSDPATSKAATEFDEAVRKRVVQERKAAQLAAKAEGRVLEKGILDEDVAKAVRAEIDARKHVAGAEGEFARALDQASKSVGEVRPNAGTAEIRKGLKSGKYKKTGAWNVRFADESTYGTTAIGQISGAEGELSSARNSSMAGPGSYITSTGKKAGVEAERKFKMAIAKDVLSRRKIDMLEGPRPQPFANSPQFQPKIDLTGSPGGMARSSASYTRTNNLALERARRLEEEKLAKELNIASESASPSKATKRAAKNMVDGVTEGIAQSRPKVKAAANTAMEEALLANSGGGEYTNLATETEPGLAATSRSGGRFAKFNQKRMATRAKLQSRMPKMMTGRFSGLGMGLGLQLAGQFAAPMINKLPGGDVANSAITGASYGAFLGPEGALAGAAIGGIIGGISKLINSEKMHEASAKATFTASASAASMFGGAVTKAATPTGNLNSIMNSIVPKTQQVTDAVKSFISEINKLPKDDPMSLILQKMKNAGSSTEAGKIASTFAATQMAINGMQPEQAQKMIDLYMAASGYKGKSIKVPTLEKATTAALDSAVTEGRTTATIGTHVGAVSQFKGNQQLDPKAVKDLVNAISQTSPTFVNYKGQLDGITKSKNNTIAATKKYADAIREENPDLAKNIDAFGRMKLKLSDITTILALRQKDSKSPLLQQIIDAAQKGDAASLAKDLGLANTELERLFKIKPLLDPTLNANGTPLSAEELAAQRVTALQKKYKPLLDQESKRTTELERQKKLMDDQNTAAQDAIGYATQQTDLQGQIRMAMASGDYLKANLLRQQMAGNADKYQMGVISNKNTQTIDQGRQLYADAQSKIADGKSLTKAEVSALQNYKPTLGKYNLGSVNMPAAVQYGNSVQMGTNTTTNPVYNIVINGANMSAEQIVKEMKRQEAMSSTKSKVGG